MEEPRAKRRKVAKDKNIVKIGRHFVSLEGYLTAPKQPVQDKPETTNEEATTTSGSSVQAETDAPNAPKHEFKSKAREDPGLLKTRSKLPIWPHKNQIQRAIEDKDILLLVGETGSGKSTQVPQFLYEQPWCKSRVVMIRENERSVSVNVGGMVAVTQPRRVAATTLAHRVSREAGTPLGKGSQGLVGYSVRFDHCVPRGTRIKFLTEGMLLQELLRDPHLRQYSAVIVDEIHERSVDVDLLCGFLKQILHGDKAGRGGIPLKVVAMSATADVEAISKFFSSPLDKQNSLEDISSLDFRGLSLERVNIKGRQYPVELKYESKPIKDLRESLIRTIFKIHVHEALPGDILVFLWGQEEIESIQKRVEEYAATLASNVPKVAVFPLFGQLSMEAQHMAFQPVKHKLTRKIILATNIAETSVTVPGVRYVVDCGKAKVKQFRSRLGMESLLAKPISKSSAIQRTGRAGREGPGKCFRLYTEETYGTLPEKDIPEILRVDVSGAVLTMLARGVHNVFTFPLMSSPDAESLEKALISLHLLKAVGDDGEITPEGRQMALFPVPASYAKVLLAATDPKYDCLLETIDIIACLTAGENLFQQVHSEQLDEAVEELRKELYRREGDLITYLTTIQKYTAENADRVSWCKARRINMRTMRQALSIRKQLRAMCLKQKLLAEVPPADPQPFIPLSPERAEGLVKCFLKGFMLKTAMLAPDKSYVTTQGKHVVAIHPSSVLRGQKKEAIMFLEHVFTQKNYAKKVSVVQADWIVDAVDGRL